VAKVKSISDEDVPKPFKKDPKMKKSTPDPKCE
jgi:hypothetical protein